MDNAELDRHIEKLKYITLKIISKNSENSNHKH